MKLRKKQFKKYVKWLSNWGQNVPKSGDKMSPNFGTKCPPKKLKGVGQNVECKSDTVRKK